MFQVLPLIQLGVAALVLAAAYKWKFGSHPPSSRLMALLGGAWVALATWPFWVAGDASFAATNSELDYPLTLIPLVDAAKARFLPAVAGGVDTFGEIFSGSYISLEYALLSWLPLPAAHALHKIAVVSVSFGGMFILARAMGVAPLLALAAAALFSVSHERILLITWAHGLGFALPPLAAWVVVCRLGRPRYWLGVIALSALIAISSSPTHSVPVVVVTIAATALIWGRGAWWRMIPAIALIMVMVVANWHEALFAKALLSPWTARGQYLPHETRMLGVLQILAGLGGVVAWAVGRGLTTLARPVSALVFAGLFGPVVMIVIQEIPALGPLTAINFGNMQIAFTALAALVFAMGLDGLPTWRFAVPAGLAFAAAQMAWFQVYIPLVWLSEGGVSQVTSAVSQLRNAAWRPSEPERVVSVTYRLPANAALLAGFDTADGGYAMALKSQEHFWGRVVAPHAQEGDSGFLGFQQVALNWKCCQSYAVADFADLDLLRMANVGFILSRVPLHGQGVIQVEGPIDALPPRASQPAWERARAFVRELFHPAGVRVYALEKPLPRVFAATGVTVVPDVLSDAAFFTQLRSAGRTVLAREAQAAALAEGAGKSFTITGFGQQGDTVAVAVDAPQGGVLVVNVPYLPFWHAYADGKAVKVVPVNGIHMAAVVPPGSRGMEFRYERPLLREVAAGLMASTQPPR